MKTCYLLICCTLFFASLLEAQENNLSQAQSLATSAEHARANEILESYLLEYPEDLSAQLLHAHNLSWWQHYSQAIAAFESILQKQPGTIDALVGLGYAYAWSGQTAKAIYPFNQALLLDAQHTDAQKGLAFTYLKANNGTAASTIFRQLIRQFPNDPTFRVGLGKALMIEAQRAEARSIFEQVLEEEPDNQEARFLLSQLTQSTSLLELDVWGGYSKVGEEEEWGLRQAQLSYHFNKRYTVIARYDNTLSLDNRDFIRQNDQAPAAWLGGFIAWNEDLATRLDVGRRFFDQRDDQLLLKGEQIFYFPNGYALKGGGFLGLADDTPTEWFLQVGGHIPISAVFALEPAYYYGQDNRQFDGQHRAVLAGQFKWPVGFEMTLGAFFGKADVGLEGGEESIKGAYFLAYYPLSKNIWSEFAINHEEGVFDTATVYSVGLRFRWE